MLHNCQLIQAFMKFVAELVHVTAQIELSLTGCGSSRLLKFLPLIHYKPDSVLQYCNEMCMYVNLHFTYEIVFVRYMMTKPYSEIHICIKGQPELHVFCDLYV